MQTSIRLIIQQRQESMPTFEICKILKTNLNCLKTHWCNRFYFYFDWWFYVSLRTKSSFPNRTTFLFVVVDYQIVRFLFLFCFLISLTYKSWKLWRISYLTSAIIKLVVERKRKENFRFRQIFFCRFHIN